MQVALAGEGRGTRLKRREGEKGMTAALEEMRGWEGVNDEEKAEDEEMGGGEECGAGMM